MTPIHPQTHAPSWSARQRRRRSAAFPWSSATSRCALASSSSPSCCLARHAASLRAHASALASRRDL